MAREIRFVNRSLIDGLSQVFRSSPFLALCTCLIILTISSVIPLSFLWLIQTFLLETPLISIHSPVLQTLLTLWSTAEVAFLVYQCYLYTKIQHPVPAPHITSVERDRLVSYALANIKNVPQTLSKWFMECPFEDIDRESIVAWLAYAFYSKDADGLNESEYGEINSFIQKVEEQSQMKANGGKSKKKIYYMKHILDPVRVIFRPLIFYVVTDTIVNGILARVNFYLRGYQFGQIGHLQFWTHAPRSNCAAEPIVFFHGIGAGLLMYQPFISYLHKRFAHNRRIILVSMRCVTMRYPSLQDIPNMSETTESLKLICDHYKIKKATFIGHSYGSACLSWIAQKCPEYISRLIFIDPICFALFEPYVVYNFVYRAPYRLGHLYLYYFVCREMGISYVVSRHFWWTQNNLYIEQIESCANKQLKTHVLLSERDCIVNSHLVRDYLVDHHIDFYMAPKLCHGDYMIDSNSWKKICEWID